ncbi:MAG TPA: hypothetical protein VF811_11125 [Parasulfuritortus sp.]
MDKHLCFARTEKGREELLGSAKTLKARPRQVLFLVGDSISVGELKDKLPTCTELVNILEQLWEDGYIGQVKSSRLLHKDEAETLASSPLEAARQHALRILATLAGEQSPIYIQVGDAKDVTSFVQAIAHGKKMLAAIASAAQATTFEQTVLSILKPALAGEVAHVNGIEHAKGRALEIISSLVGTRSPVYAKVQACHSHADLIDAVNAGKKVISAVASASHGQNFENEVLALLTGD